MFQNSAKRSNSRLQCNLIQCNSTIPYHCTSSGMLNLAFSCANRSWFAQSREEIANIIRDGGKYRGCYVDVDGVYRIIDNLQWISMPAIGKYNCCGWTWPNGIAPKVDTHHPDEISRLNRILSQLFRDLTEYPALFLSRIVVYFLGE